MKRKAVIAASCLLALPYIGCTASSTSTAEKPAATPAQPAKPTDATTKTVAAANAFLATLDETGRGKVSFPFDSELKKRWSNFPVGMYPRHGLRMGDLNTLQRDAVLALLGTALSARGLQKVKEIMEGDEVLKNSDEERAGPPAGPPPDTPPDGAARPQGGPPRGMDPGFGRDNYYIALFGTPSLAEPWMIQFGGHHLAINLTIVGRSNVLTPSLPAAQPAIYKLNSEAIRPLGRENDKGFALINSLDATQQKQAILSYQVNDLVLGAGQDGKMVQPEGIKVSALNPAQQEKLWRGNAGLDINHIHTIYRDPTNDYGARLVKQ